MEKNMKLLLRKILGIVLIIGGILGLFLPFLQGVVMILVGLALLGNGQVIQWMKQWFVNVQAYFGRKNN